MDEVTKDNAVEIVVHPDVTQEQLLAFLNILGDLFEACGGKGGLKVESVRGVVADA